MRSTVHPRGAPGFVLALAPTASQKAQQGRAEPSMRSSAHAAPCQPPLGSTLHWENCYVREDKGPPCKWKHGPRQTPALCGATLIKFNPGTNSHKTMICGRHTGPVHVHMCTDQRLPSTSSNPAPAQLQALRLKAARFAAHHASRKTSWNQNKAPAQGNLFPDLRARSAGPLCRP
jgi:hypothetical protein